MATEQDVNIDAIARHYRHAKEKHPYFADMLQYPPAVVPMRDYEASLASNRWALSDAIKKGHVMLWHVLDCELGEMRVEIARGDKARAVEECYDAIAVLLRVVDVLEGRQKLGKPEKNETHEAEEQS